MPEHFWKDSRWRDKQTFEVGVPVCEDTGVASVMGECPIHYGDACLYSSAVLVTALRELVP